MPHHFRRLTHDAARKSLAEADSRVRALAAMRDAGQLTVDEVATLRHLARERPSPAARRQLEGLVQAIVGRGVRVPTE